MGLPALFVVGAGILSPLALAELIKPARYGQPIDPGGLALYGTLSIVFLGLAAHFLAAIRTNRPGATHASHREVQR
jgi:hypothetical protein